MRNTLIAFLIVAVAGTTAGALFYARQPEAADVTPAAAAAGPEILVHKTPWCGCCSQWVDHLREHGFAVTVEEHEDLAPVRSSLGVPPELTSCHTAEVGGYSIEGHVPAPDIRRLLAERPDGVQGLAVPGMPLGSPGMEAPGREQPYDVVTFGEDGKRVFAEHRP